ncbi:hypothetical protein WMY93_010076 [Mugilogobius chulae]|uniref:Uroporphyrinogen-III synthase n=1 Tax=Mugilogobius chulae TaxID=88201 RepID=A0AAW0PA26_9GOBI
MNVLLLKEPRDGESAPDPYIKELAERGHKATLIPVLSFKFVSLNTLSDKIFQPEKHGGLIFTSPRAVEAVRKCVEERRQEWESSVRDKWNSKSVYVVGKATAALVQTLGLNPLGDDTGTADVLSKLIIEREDKNIPPLFFPCGSIKREVLPTALKDNGVPLETLTVYQTAEHPDLEKNLKNYFSEQGVPASVAFFSPSGVKFCLELVQRLSGEQIAQIKFAAIGPTTEEAMRAEEKVKSNSYDVRQENCELYKQILMIENDIAQKKRAIAELPKLKYVERAVLQRREVLKEECAKLDKKSELVRDLRAENAKREDEIKNVHEENEAVQSRYEDLYVEVYGGEMLEMTKRRQTAELEEIQKRKNSAESELKLHEKPPTNILMIENKIAQKKRAIAELPKLKYVERAVLQRREVLKKECAKLDEKSALVCDLRAENAKREVEIKNVHEENEAVQSRYEDLAENAKREVEIKNVHEENEAVQSRYEDLYVEVYDAEMLQMTKRRQTAELEEIQKRKNSAESELKLHEQAQTKCTQKTRHLTRLKIKTELPQDELRRKADQMRREIDVLRESFVETQKRYSDSAEDNLEELKSQKPQHNFEELYVQLTAARDEKREDVEQLQSEISDTIRKLAQESCWQKKCEAIKILMIENEIAQKKHAIAELPKLKYVERAVLQRRELLKKECAKLDEKSALVCDLRAENAKREVEIKNVHEENEAVQSRYEDLYVEVYGGEMLQMTKKRQTAELEEIQKRKNSAESELKLHEKPPTKCTQKTRHLSRVKEFLQLLEARATFAVSVC